MSPRKDLPPAVVLGALVLVVVVAVACVVRLTAARERVVNPADAMRNFQAARQRAVGPPARP